MSAHAEHEARLRAALHAAADSLEPHGDGLERIRARLRKPRPASIAWAQAASGELVMRAPAWLQDAIYQVAGWLRLVSERFAPAQAPGKHRSRTQGMLRPLTAMAVVMFIVAAGTYVAIDASTAIFPSSSNSQPGGGPKIGGRTAAPATSHTSGTQSALGTGSHPSASPSCSPGSPKAKRTTSAPAPQPSASPSESLSSSPAPSDSTSADAATPPTGNTSTTAAAPASAAASVAPPPAASPTIVPVLTKSPGC